jgi:hypothetical protein
MNIIQIAQGVELSEQFKNWITRKVQPSMQDSEKEIFQYHLEIVKEQMNYWEGVLDEKPTWTSSDSLLIQEYKELSIDYLEF